MAKILIIDDDVGIIKSLKCLLEMKDFKVITARDAESGMEKIRSGKPDLLIIDMSLPDGNGRAFIKSLKAEEGARNMPIIVISGRDPAGDSSGIEGVAAYFVKPFDPAKLIEKISENLN